MLQITPHHRLLLATKYADFRKGIDGLAALCRQRLKEDPFGGTIFVFTNRTRKAIKILLYDGNGFWLCQKRFSRGQLAWWPSEQETSSFSVTPSQLQTLFSQGNPEGTQTPPDWRPITLQPLPTKPPSLEHPP